MYWTCTGSRHRRDALGGRTARLRRGDGGEREGARRVVRLALLPVICEKKGAQKLILPRAFMLREACRCAPFCSEPRRAAACCSCLFRSNEANAAGDHARREETGQRELQRSSSEASAREACFSGKWRYSWTRGRRPAYQIGKKARVLRRDTHMEMIALIRRFDWHA